MEPHETDVPDKIWVAIAVLLGALAGAMFGIAQALR